LRGIVTSFFLESWALSCFEEASAFDTVPLLVLAFFPDGTDMVRNKQKMMMEFFVTKSECIKFGIPKGRLQDLGYVYPFSFFLLSCKSLKPEIKSESKAFR